MSLPRPVPVLRGEEELYFERARDSELVFQRCRDCAVHQWYPRVLCATCGSVALETVPSVGTGTIHSFTTAYRAGHPSRSGEVPYTLVLVDLEEGVRVFGELIEAEPGEVGVGMPVMVDFQQSDEIVLPVFRQRGPLAGEEAR